MLSVATVLCVLVLVVSGQNIIELPPGEVCPPCDCNRDDNCNEIDIANPCSCCTKCNKGVGEECGTDDGECSSNLLCLPDDPYSANYKGKCYAITPCLTFGCMEDNGKCSCYYNNVCPLQRFPYYTKEECEDAIKIERCKEVTCPTTLNEEECGEGMYYEEGPSFFDHCCPANGRCVCNITLCDDDPPEECPEGNKLMTEKADHQKGQCCDNHYCKKVTCNHKGIQFMYGDTWKDGQCTNCSCTNNGLMCVTMNCTLPYDTCTDSYIPEGKCCPVCVPPLTGPTLIAPTGPTLIAPTGPTLTVLCLTKDGVEYSPGLSWDASPCQKCHCNDDGSIECNDKVCDEIVCQEGEQEYYLPKGSCCPICKDITLTNNSSDMSENNDTSPSNTTTIPSNTTTIPSNTTTTPSNTGTTPTTKPSNHMINKTRNLVLLLNVPFNEVKSRWEEFSMELMVQLKEKSVNVQNISIRPDTSSNINATIITMRLQTAVNETSHEADIALVVNQMAMDYSMTMLPPLSTNGAPIAVIEDETQSQLTASIIVLTLLAAITLVSFIGVVVILVMINRRLKTAKTIRGIPTRPSRAP